MSQKNHIEFEGPGAEGENFIFESTRRRVHDFRKIPKKKRIGRTEMFFAFVELR